MSRYHPECPLCKQNFNIIEDYGYWLLVWSPTFGCPMAVAKYHVPEFSPRIIADIEREVQKRWGVAPISWSPRNPRSNDPLPLRRYHAFAHILAHDDSGNKELAKIARQVL